MVWPFTRGGPRNQNAGGLVDATSAAVNDLVGQAVGKTPDARTTAAVAIAAGYWSRSLAAAEVKLDGGADEIGLTELLPAIAWRLALDGEAALWMESGQLAIGDVSAVTGAGSRPEKWNYVLIADEATGNRQVNLPGRSVAHIRIGQRQTWRGTPPWKSANLTSGTLAEIERGLAKSASRDNLSIVGLTGQGARILNNEQLKAVNEQFREARKGNGPLILSGGTVDLQETTIAPDSPARPGIVAEMLAAYGLSPVLITPNTASAAIREAMRLLVASTIRPIAAIAEREIGRVTGREVAIDLHALRTVDHQAQARAAKAFKDAGFDLAEIRELLDL